MLAQTLAKQVFAQLSLIHQILMKTLFCQVLCATALLASAAACNSNPDSVKDAQSINEKKIEAGTPDSTSAGDNLKDTTMTTHTKLALVTGATRGIGLETVRQLARQDVHVLLAGRWEVLGLPRSTDRPHRGVATAG